jgi:deaminated glutathione amidase
MRFPEASLILRKCGAELLTYPSAFAYSTGKAHWEILLRARAIENQCFVVAAAQIGFHNAKRQSWGHATVGGVKRLFEIIVENIFLIHRLSVHGVKY